MPITCFVHEEEGFIYAWSRTICLKSRQLQRHIKKASLSLQDPEALRSRLHDQKIDHAKQRINHTAQIRAQRVQAQAEARDECAEH
ncbi:hypothetical protein SUGI_0739600 [Cryptomeria japonica]|nr:hypothetical protein SUGI_0739600 [Cryptomeria japonica]